MQAHYNPNTIAEQAQEEGLLAAPLISDYLRRHLHTFLAPLIAQFHSRCDARLVRTFLALVEVILCFRNRAHGLLLSELGGYLLGPHHAPAGTKRLSNLLRSPKWNVRMLDLFLWRVAQARHDQLTQEQKTILVVWDESVLEKNESRKLEGLGPVRSSKAARCLAHKPGFHRPPTNKPIFVPGMNWISLLLLGPSGPPTVATMRWFTTRGEGKTSARRVQSGLLTRCKNLWGKSVVHVFDRGYAGGPWLERLCGEQVRFIVRWPKRYFLHRWQADQTLGPGQNAWKVVRGQRAQDSRMLRDGRLGSERKVSILWREVRHPEFVGERLWLVVARRGGGQQPWYLLTNEPVTTKDEAWAIVFGYVRRWQIELAFRYNKSELAMESPRLWSWERRVRLLLIVTLVYAFLLLLLAPMLAWLREWLLRHFCHRTGKRSREVSAPLYRMRAAISRLWLEWPEDRIQNSG